MDSDTLLRFYRLKANLSPGVFGETYVVTAFDPPTQGIDQRSVQCEYVIFITRPKEQAIRGSFRLPYGELPGNLGVYGPEEVHAEAANQAILDLSERLTLRAKELERSELDMVYLDLEIMNYRPMTGAWIHGKWNSHIQELSRTAETEVLETYCKLLKRVPMFSKPKSE